MSNKPKDSLGKRKRKSTRDPFDPAILRQARRFAAQYKLVLEPSKNLGFIGTSIEIPTAFADGKTPDACVKATREALTLAAATMLECGHKPPTPASAGKRNVQVNVRFAALEKVRLTEAARSHGFRSVSDLIRSASLAYITARA